MPVVVGEAVCVETVIGPARKDIREVIWSCQVGREHEHVAPHEILKPLDARQDKDMNWRWHVGCSSERPLPSIHAFSEATEF